MNHVPSPTSGEGRTEIPPQPVHPGGARVIPPKKRGIAHFVIFVTNFYMPAMSSAYSTLRTAWFALLVLLLGLAPFIHGHLGQPQQQGWHIHAQSVTAEIQADPQFNGLSCPAVHHVHAGTAVSAPFALQQPEPADVELASGIMQTRLPQIALAATFTALETPLAAPSRSSAVPALRIPATAWPPTSNAVGPRQRHGLPPPGQAPPSLLV